MSWLLYAALAVCLFFGAKACGKDEWNGDALSYAQTKSFLGFCALIILLHHCALRTCSPWLAPYRVVHGLDAFLYLGYLCVAAFFFCSGYGMYSASRREGAFDGYYKRILRVVLPAAAMWLTFFLIEKGKGMRIEPPVWINTFDYIWYILAVIWLYLFFYLSFRLIRSEKAGMAVMICGTCAWFVLCLIFSPGTWWYNTPHLFLLGIITAKNKEKLRAFFRKRYPVWLVLSFVITAAGFYVAGYYEHFAAAFGIGDGWAVRFIAELTGQVVSATSFVLFVVLLGMKVKIGNGLLLFLGRFTLEIYLVHPLFVQLFGFAFIQDTAKPLYHIRDPFLYALAVAVISIPPAYLLHELTALAAGRSRSDAASRKQQAPKNG